MPESSWGPTQGTGMAPLCWAGSTHTNPFRGAQGRFGSRPGEQPHSSSPSHQRPVPLL